MEEIMVKECSSLIKDRIIEKLRKKTVNEKLERKKTRIEELEREEKQSAKMQKERKNVFQILGEIGSVRYFLKSQKIENFPLSFEEFKEVQEEIRREALQRNKSLTARILKALGRKTFWDYFLETNRFRSCIKYRTGCMNRGLEMYWTVNDVMRGSGTLEYYLPPNYKDLFCVLYKEKYGIKVYNNL